MITRCYGVDFSGAGRDDRPQANIALASGRFDAGEWTIRVRQNLSRDQVQDEVGRSGPSIWALDFPFSLPTELCNMWFRDVRQSRNVWRILDRVPQVFLRLLAAAWKLTDFETTQVSESVIQLLRCAEALRRPPEAADEPLRQTDRDLGGQSCIHTVNPDMIPMVHRGTALLHRLHGSCAICPWDEPTEEHPTVVETYPAAVRSALGLLEAPSTQDIAVATLRIGVRVNVENYTPEGRNWKDARDAVLACINSIWLATGDNLKTHTGFLRDRYKETWLLEGAIYVPTQEAYDPPPRRGDPRPPPDDLPIDPALAVQVVPREDWPPPSPGRQCQFCGRCMRYGIDAHVKRTHKFDFEAYKRLYW